MKTHYPSDRVTDNTADFLHRYRLNSARSKRLRRESEATIAAYHQIIKDTLGAIALTALFTAIFYLAFAL
jgi:hypothetical protein